jgi:PhzF family phenazine biosynthesis protein
MNFPAQPPPPAEPLAGVMPALGHPATVATAYNPETHVHLIEVQDEATVRGMQPDFAALKAVTRHGVIVTSRASTPGFDFISRFFAPAVGINEDPVTGGAHCALAPYWAAKLDRVEMTGFQASARGGVVRVRYLGDRVDLIGAAVTTLRGELLA